MELSAQKNKTSRVLHKFKKSERGAMFVEMAIVLPIFILLISGIFEISMYILIHNKLLRVAGVIGDTITRQNTTAANIIAILDTSDNLFQPLTFAPAGSVVVTQISNSKLSASATDMLINWQYSINGAVSKFGTTGNFPSNLPNNISTINNQSMVLTEVFYQYKPLVFPNFIANQTIYITSVYAPRMGDMNVLTG